MRKIVGENVRRSRLRLGLTQEQLAEKMGVEPRTVQRLEAGASAALVTIVGAADALRTAVVEMFQESTIAIEKRRNGRPRSSR